MREPSLNVSKFMERSMRLPDENMAYGKPLRPSTPIKEVIGHYYGDMAEQMMLSRYDFLKQESSF